MAWFRINPVYLKYLKPNGEIQCSLCKRKLSREERIYSRSDMLLEVFACPHCITKLGLKPRIYYDGGKAWAEYRMRNRNGSYRWKRVPHLDVKAVDE